jgi:hypothetical protein
MNARGITRWMPLTHTESTQRGARFRSRAPYVTLGSWASAERYPQRVFCRLWAQAHAVPFGGGVMECGLVRHETCTETYVQTEEQADRLRSVDACLVRSGGACPTGTECCDDPSPRPVPFSMRKQERRALLAAAAAPAPAPAAPSRPERHHAGTECRFFIGHHERRICFPK